jgi:hypothetical protein
MQRLDESARQVIENSRASVLLMLRLLCEGAITVAQLQFVQLHHERFTAVVAAVGQNKEKVQQVRSKFLK